MSCFKYLFIALLFIPAGLFAQSDEVLNVPWPTEYKWKVLTDTTQGSVHMVESIPDMERADNWTIKAVTVALSEMHGVPMDTTVGLIVNQAKAGAPKATVTILEENDTADHPYVLLTVETPYFDNDPKPMSQVMYFVEGNQGGYFAYVAVKHPALTKEFINVWSKYLKQSTLTYK